MLLSPLTYLTLNESYSEKDNFADSKIGTGMWKVGGIDGGDVESENSAVCESNV